MYKTMKIKPLADRVLVKPDAAEEKTAGGLIIPDTAKEKPLDKVLYGKYAGTEITHDGETYLMMKLGDIFAVLS